MDASRSWTRGVTGKGYSHDVPANPASDGVRPEGPDRITWQSKCSSQAEPVGRVRIAPDARMPLARAKD